MPDPIAKAAEAAYVHRDMMLPRELDDQIAREAARLRVIPVSLIWEALRRHFAADDGAITYDEVESMFANEAVTVSQRNGQVGVCIDCWVPLKTKHDAQLVLAALNIPAPSRLGSE